MDNVSLFWSLSCMFIGGAFFGYWIRQQKPMHPSIEEQMNKKYKYSEIIDVIEKPINPPVLYDLNNSLDLRAVENKNLLGI
jgi:hypothetical protein